MSFAISGGSGIGNSNPTNLFFQEADHVQNIYDTKDPEMAWSYFARNRQLLEKPANCEILGRFDGINRFLERNNDKRSLAVSKALLDHFAQFGGDENNNGPSVFFSSLKNFVKLSEPRETIRCLNDLGMSRKLSLEHKTDILYKMAHTYAFGLHQAVKALEILDQYQADFSANKLFILKTDLLRAEIKADQGQKNEARVLLRGALDKAFETGNFDIFCSLVIDWGDYPHLVQLSQETPAIINYKTQNKEDIVNPTLLYLLILPEEFIHGLKKINVRDTREKKFDGKYYPFLSAINTTSSWRGGRVLVHEAAHHWYINVAASKQRSIFENISWDTLPAICLGIINRSLNSWFYTWIGTDSKYFDNGDFASGYAKVNWDEDFAESVSTYMCEPENLRAEIRHQMASGNFELAIKYLFVKICTPMKGKEYQISPDSPSISLEEVENKLNFSYGTSVPDKTRNLLKEIKNWGQ